MNDPRYDVAIIGGGPAGSTTATFLRKYNPKLKVVILEREKFPRDHVGESQLPIIGKVLDEMGVWDKVERANFPVKIGATYRWGRKEGLWDFQFLENGIYSDDPRPGKYKGERTLTAFQVDRAVYDKILLDHAASLGTEVREQTTVRQVKREGDKVTGLVLADGSEITARYYIDCSGHTGIIRRAMGVETTCPTHLQNIAIWEYWQNAEWATTVGAAATRILVMSLGYGWMWFIPLSPTRTSLGLVLPAEYYKNSGKKPKELYDEAIRSEPLISHLTRNGQSEGNLYTTKDWSFLSDRLVGENWFLAGEACGFADPILSAGMSLAHMGGRDVAYTIMALDKGEYDAEWLKARYDEAHRTQIGNHISFADFWYTHNGVFTDLADFTQKIAGERGLNMTPAEAWQWFGTGGFIEENATISYGTYSLGAARAISAEFLGGEMHWESVGKTHFKLDLEGAEKAWNAEMTNGQIIRRRCYKRDGKFLPVTGLVGWLVQILRTEKSYEDLIAESRKYIAANRIPESGFVEFRLGMINALEAMIGGGWVTTRTDPNARAIPAVDLGTEGVIHDNEDMALDTPSPA